MLFTINLWPARRRIWLVSPLSARKKGDPLRLYPPLNLERLKVGDCSGFIAMAAFTNGLKDMNLIKSIYTKPFQDSNDIISHAKKYMLANEALASYDSEAQDLENKPRKKQKRIKLLSKKIGSTEKSPSVAATFLPTELSLVRGTQLY